MDSIGIRRIFIIARSAYLVALIIIHLLAPKLAPANLHLPSGPEADLP